MIYDPRKNQVLIFGGGRLQSAFEGSQANELWAFNCDDLEWELITSEEPPVPVSLHATILIPDKYEVMLFGGEIGGMYSNQLLHGTWFLDLATKEWRLR